MRINSATIIYFEIYMYLRAQRGVSLQRNEPSNRLVLPDVKGQREYFEGGRRGRYALNCMLYEVAQC